MAIAAYTQTVICFSNATYELSKTKTLCTCMVISGADWCQKIK